MGPALMYRVGVMVLDLIVRIWEKLKEWAAFQPDAAEYLR